MEAQLQRAKALCDKAFGLLRKRALIAQHAAGRIGAHSIGESSQELPTGLAGDFSGKIPERKIEGPAAAVVEVNVGKDAIVALDGERVLAYEQIFMPSEANHPVARTIADETAVRRHPHDRRIQMNTRLTVPACLERRIKCEPVVGDIDRPNSMCSGGHRHVLFARTHWYAVHIVLNSVNLSIAASLEAMFEFVVPTATQAFTLAPSIKAEKLNSAIEKRHWKAFRSFEQVVLYKRCG
jgi:hypothetical protein